MKTEFLKNLKRSWSQHLWTQLATFTVLVATFTLVSSMLNLSLNLQRLLSLWGDSVQMTAYLSDEQKEESIGQLRSAIQEIGDFEQIQYISKTQARADFEQALKAFLPDIVEEDTTENPFPASLEISLKHQVVAEMTTLDFSSLAAKIGALAGVDEVSYGQDWVENYSALVSGAKQVSLSLAVILLFASILVIGNSLRASLAHRREEIEVLELLGATPTMIRAPYIFEGAVTGFIGGVLAIAFSVGLYQLVISALSQSLHLAALGSQLNFMGLPWILLSLLLFTSFGMLGSYFTVRRLNHGYAAARGR